MSSQMPYVSSGENLRLLMHMSTCTLCRILLLCFSEVHEAMKAIGSVQSK